MQAKSYGRSELFVIDIISFNKNILSNYYEFARLYLYS